MHAIVGTKRFEERRNIAKLKDGPGAPSRAITEASINMCGTLLAGDPTMTLEEIAIVLQVSHASGQRIVKTELQFTKMCATLD